MLTKRDPKTGAIQYIKTAEDVEKEKNLRNIRQLQRQVSNLESRLSLYEKRIAKLEKTVASMNKAANKESEDK